MSMPQISFYSRSRCESRNLHAAMLPFATRLAQRVQLPRMHRLRKKHFDHVSESTTGIRVMLLSFAAAHALSDSRSYLAIPHAKKITGKQSRLRCSQVLCTSHPAGVAPTKMQHHRSTHERLRKCNTFLPNRRTMRCRRKMSAGDSPRRITQTPHNAGLPAP